MNAIVRLLSAGALLGLSACASDPVHYHTLVAPPPAAATPPQPSAGFLIDVLPVGTPASIDQVQLVVRQGLDGVNVLDGERWASPLGEELRGALSAELSRRLGTQDIAGLPDPAGQQLMRIKLQVRRFDAWPGRSVLLDASWSLGFAADAANSRLLCRGQFSEPAGVGYPEMVAAQQRAIAALASRIESDARHWADSRSPDCSQQKRSGSIPSA